MIPADHDSAADPLTEGFAASSLRPVASVHGLLLVVAVGLAWRPSETFPLSAVIVAGAVLGLTVWGWRRTGPATAKACWAMAGLGLLATIAGVAGWDPSAAFPQVAFLASVAALMWLASREEPPDHWPAILGLGISLLTLWGIRQVTAGPDHAAAVLAQVPDSMRAAAAERLASGRAFASQSLPSHFAVLLATALPLLLARVRLQKRSLGWILGSILCVIGLALTRSPVGAGLALVACALFAGAKKRGPLRWPVFALVVVLLLVVFLRVDVVKLEPVGLRFDNWKTALWVWSTAPVAGVGTGGFAQAAQAVPFAVGNHPRHAHSLPLEWLAEFGPVGLLLFAWGGWLLWGLIRDLWPIRPELSVAVAVIPVHNMVDFSLYGSGVAIPWALLVGWAIAIRGAGTGGGPEPRGRVVVVTAVAVAVAATLLHTTSRVVEDAAAQRPNAQERIAEALEARRLAPWRVRPIALIASSALECRDLGSIRTAREELRRAAWLRPRSAALAGLRSRVDEALGDAPSAVSEAWVCGREQPLSREHQQVLKSLLLRVPEVGGRESH